MASRILEVPPLLRQVWGEEVADALSFWLSIVLEERAVSRDEYRQILSRLDILEHDVADLKADVQELRREMNERFDRVNERFDQMLAWTNERFDRMNERFDQMLAWANERFDRMNERLDQRFGEIDKCFDRVNERFDQMHDRMDRMYQQMVVQTRWLIGALTIIGTVITVLLAIAQFAR